MASFESQPEVSDAGSSSMDVATAIPKADESSVQIDAKSVPLSVQETEPPNAEDEKQALKARISAACEQVFIGTGMSKEELGFDPEEARRNCENFLAGMAASFNFDAAAMQASLRPFVEVVEDVVSDSPVVKDSPTAA